MTRNAQFAVNDLELLIPELLAKYVVDSSFVLNFPEVVKQGEVKKVFQIIAANCESIEDVKDVCMWINGKLPNWWNTPPFSNHMTNYFLFIYHFGEEKKSSFLLYKILMNLKGIHSKNNRKEMYKSFGSLPF